MPWLSTLASPVGATDSRLELTAPMSAQRGSNFAILDAGASLEIVRVTGIGTSALFVERGVMGTEAVPHDAGAAVSRYIASTAAAVGHPDFATHTALGLAPAADVAGHLAAADPHVAYALDADLANHETAGHVHNHDAAYAATSHAHVDGDLPAGLARDSEVTSAVATHAGTPHGGSLPAGLIAMWGGLVANIPSGWLLCDGLNGTPDLRGKFIKGAAADPGATGGSASHVHADHAAVISHTHDVAVTDPGHGHVENSNGATTGGLRGWGAADTSTSTPTATGYSTASATTGISASTANPVGSVAALTHDSVGNEPPFYALCFIQKL